MRNPKKRWALMSVLLAVMLAGCVHTTTTATLKTEVRVLDALTRYELTYLLQAGDVIEVFIYRHAELSRRATVRSDGFISLPLLGDVRAAGTSPKDLGADLAKRYSERLLSPEVTVILENPPEPLVFVVGEVGGPKALAFRQTKTAAQAIAKSGSATKSASLASVSILRVNADGLLEAHTVDTDGTNYPEAFMALQNMALRPNDLIVVPESYRGQLVRAFTDFNTILAPYFQFRILQEIAK